MTEVDIAFPKGTWTKTVDEINTSTTLFPARRLFRNSKRAINSVMPMKIGIQNLLIILDSVSRYACTE